MSLAATYADPAVRPPRAKCTMWKIKERMPVTDRDFLVDLMGDPEAEHASIARALTLEGYQVAAITVARHRRKECSCGTL